MHTIGFPISHKENEKRRTILPAQAYTFAYPERLYIESGYGTVLGIGDEEYSSVGCHVCSRDMVLKQDVICDPKVGDADYLDILSPGQVIFGWVHATQNRDITDKLINRKLTAYAWEHMHEGGRHIFWKNNELAGEAAVMHAFQCYGSLPNEAKVAVIGRGNTAKGAIKALNMLGADVIQYDRRTEALLRKEINQYDVVVNCVLWDITRSDHIISKADLARMKKNSLIIDISCDPHGGIETCVPTTIDAPTYYVDGVMHYCVDHTPALFYKSFSHMNSQTVFPYIEQFVSGDIGTVLTQSLIVLEGRIVDEEISKYQKR